MPTSQFPYPRKSSDPTSYTSTRASSYHQRRAWRKLIPYVLSGIAVLWLLWFLLSGSGSSSSSKGFGVGGEHQVAVGGKGPQAVIVTVLDPSLDPRHVQTIKDNRKDYADRHGYAIFFPNNTDYDLSNAPNSWAVIPAIRHAMTRFPDTPWVWYLTSTALIMETRESLYKRILAPTKLESIMRVDVPIVPPDSVIRTFSHVKADRIDLIISQDREGLAGGSMLVRNGDWAKYFLDAWFDPLYRSYNFQKAEAHALEHLVQWHGTVLARLALIEQRLFNSYSVPKTEEKSAYKEGDFVANFHGCLRDDERDCVAEMKPLESRWKELRDGERRR